MHSSAAAGVLADPLPDVAWSDLFHVSITAAIIAVVAIIVGIFAMHAMARRSIGLLLTLISAVTIITALAGVGGITIIMVGNSRDREVMLELLIITGLDGFAVALMIGRRLTWSFSTSCCPASTGLRCAAGSAPGGPSRWSC